MEIPLDHFEQYIDETILKRGLDYFRSGRVRKFEMFGHGMWEAKVVGRENYKVVFLIEDDVVTEYGCNCPYDQGPVCKHVVAAIFYLKRVEMEEDGGKVVNMKGDEVEPDRKPAKRKPKADEAGELIGKIPRDQLVKFVREQAARDTAFRRSLLAKFAHLGKKESKAMYKKQIRNIVTAAGKRHGFVDWQDAMIVGSAVGDLLDAATGHYENGNFQSAFLIACAVLEEMTRALDFVDDSGDDVGSNIDRAMEMLSDLSEAEVPLEVRRQVLDYAFNSYEKGIFKGWDWNFGLLEIAYGLVADKGDIDKLLALLNGIKMSDSAVDFEAAQLLKMGVVILAEGPEAGRQYAEDNRNVPALREHAIRMAMLDGDVKKATRFAREGLKQDAGNVHRVGRWQWLLLEIAEEQNDTESIITYARKFFLEDHHDSDEYYEMLKTHVSPADWQGFVAGMTADLKAKQWWGKYNKLLEIYMYEQAWQDLIDTLKQGLLDGALGLYHLENYETHLAGSHAAELAELYEYGVLVALERASDRQAYKEACRFIRHIRKLGARGRADLLIKKLSFTYKQRPALLDELSKI